MSDLYVFQTNVDGAGHDGWKSTRGTTIVHGATASTKRFPGDPGPGNFYFGGRPDTLSGNSPPGYSSRVNAWNGWESKMATWRNSKPLAISRLYLSGDLNTGWASGDTGSIVPDSSRGMILSISFKYPTQWGGTTQAAMDTAYAFGAPWNTWMDNLAAAIIALNMPVWITFFHEPEDHKAWTNGPLKYRAIQRKMVQDLKARGANNFAFVPGYVQAPYIYGGKGGPTDWNTYYPDWKGTYTNFSGGGASSAMNPNPVDYYVHGDPNSVVDAIGLDIYSWWTAETYKNQETAAGSGVESVTNYQTFDSLFAPMKGAQDFLNKPYVIGEFGVEAYHTGCYVPPAAGTVQGFDGRTLNPPGDGVFTGANDQRTLDFLTGMGALLGPYNICGVMVYNYMLSHDPWRLEYGDPNGARYHGYGLMLGQSNSVMPVLT